MSGSSTGSAFVSPPGRSLPVVALVVVTVLGFGFGTGAFGPVALGVLSALWFVGGCCLLATGTIRDRAIGSIATVAGFAGLVGSAWVGRFGGFGVVAQSSTMAADLIVGLVVVAWVAVAAVGCALVAADGHRDALLETVRIGSVAAAIATPIVALVFDGRLLVWSWLSTRLTVTTLSQHPSTVLITLQLLAVGAFVLAVVSPTARRQLRRVDVSIPRIDDVVDSVRDRHEITWYLLAGYVVVWALPGTRAAIDSTFAALGPAGRAVEALLTSGLPVVLGLVAVLGLVVVSTAPILAQSVRSSLEPVPLVTLASATGGVVAPITIFGAERLATGGTDPTLAEGLVVVAWVGAIAVLLGVLLVSRLLGERRWRERLVGIAAGSVLLGTVLAGAAGLHPVGVVAGIASVLLAWDLGIHGLSMHRTVGPETDSAGPRATHAVATTIVLAVGASVSLGVVYAARWIGPSVAQPIATVAIVLSLLALSLVAASTLRLVPTWYR